MKKVIFVLTNHTKLGNTGKLTGWYLPEVAHPYFILSDAGISIDFVSPLGGNTEPDENSINLADSDNKHFFESHDLMEKTQNTLSPAQINFEKYDAIFFAGGHGTMWDFPGNKELTKIAAQIYENGGIIAAICHGTCGLLNIRLSNGDLLIKGKNINSFTNNEEDEINLSEAVPFLLETKLIENGANFVKGGIFEPFLAVDERIITGQNEFSAKLVGEEILRQILRP